MRSNSFTKATSAHLASLVSTLDALLEHIKRVHFEVQLWLGNVLPPEDWGWKCKNDLLKTVTMDQPPIPENLLQMIFDL